MLDRRDPETPDMRRHRADEAGRQFNAGEITEPVYRATLFGLGYRGAEIHAEVVQHSPTPRSASTTVCNPGTGFVSAMAPDYFAPIPRR